MLVRSAAAPAAPAQPARAILSVKKAAGEAAAPMERELDDRLSRAERLMLIELLRKVAGR